MEKKTPPQSQPKGAWGNQGALRDQLRAQVQPSAQQTGQTGAQQQVGQYAFSQQQTRQETIDDYAASISSYKGLAGPVLAIEAGHSGDMYDIALAFSILRFVPTIVIWGFSEEKRNKATQAARLFHDVGGKQRKGSILYTDLKPPEGEGPANKELESLVTQALTDKQWATKPPSKLSVINEGKATSIVAFYAKAVGEKERGAIGDLLAPESLGIDDKIKADLEKHGFSKDKTYVIVNYRESGHHGGGTAPALDTGTQGMEQLMQAVWELRLGIPVPMGEHKPKAEFEAELIDYFKWPSCKGLGRAAEARVLRVLAREFKVVGAVGMRSGVTDLLMYMGIPTLSIDIHPERGVTSKGWQRSFKRSAAFGERYQRHYLKEERKGELDVDEKGGKGQQKWAGSFKSKDLEGIKGSLRFLVRKDVPPWNNDPLNLQDLAYYAAMAETRANHSKTYAQAELLAQELEEVIQTLMTPAWVQLNAKAKPIVKTLERILSTLRK